MWQRCVMCIPFPFIHYSRTFSQIKFCCHPIKLGKFVNNTAEMVRYIQNIDKILHREINEF
jgi:hypothetical protein